MNTEGRVTTRGANRLFLISMLMQFVVGIIISIIIVAYIFVSGREELSQDTYTYTLLVLTQIIAVLLPAMIYLKFKKVKVKEVLRFKPIKLPQIGLIIILGLTGQFIAQLLNFPIILLLQLLGEIPPPVIPIPENLHGLAVSIIIIAVFPAVCEEIFMRGIVMRAYERRGTKAAIVLSAILFGLMHGDIKNLIGPIFFGLLFGYLVIRTGSIFAGMIAHFINNAVAITLEYFYQQYHTTFPFLDSFEYFVITIVISIMFFIPTLILFNKTTVFFEEQPVSSVGRHLKATFINVPIIATLVIYVFLQVFVIAGIMMNA